MVGKFLLARKSVSGRVDDMFLMKSRLGNLPNLIRRVRFCSSLFTLVGIVVHIMKQFDVMYSVDLTMMLVGL